MQETISTILLPAFGASILILMIILICRKRICCPHRHVNPSRNPQLAFITQGYLQQQPYYAYRVPKPATLMELPPPPYHTVMTNETTSSIGLYRKQ